jgi:hypothetical protein
MKPTTNMNVCCVKQGSISLMAGWHLAFRGGGSVGEER